MKMPGQSPPVTNVVFDAPARESLKRGLDVAARAVGCTMGPRGKNVLIQRGDAVPLVTKDGVTVSKSIRLKNPIERMGADLVKEAASRTNDVAGDGTTTATVLTHALVTEGLKLLAAGHSGVELKKGIEVATKAIIEELKGLAKEVKSDDEIVQIGTISANGDKVIGELIGQAMKKVGRDGIITVEDAKGMNTTLDVVEGMQFDRGYISPMFATSGEKMNAVYEDAFVLLTDKKLSSLRELIPVLEGCQKAQRGLLIIADDVEGEALHGLLINKLNAGLKVVAIRAPGFGTLRESVLQDLAILTGGKVVSSTTGLSLDKVTVAELGKVKKFMVDAKTTTIVGSGATAEAVNKHADDLRAQLEDVRLSDEDKVILKNRIAKLASGVAVIRVGGSTEVEMIERKYRIEDALHATAAAVDEGILPGGGCALIRAVKQLNAKQTGPGHNSFGEAMVYKACQAPLRKIVENAGLTADVILNDLGKSDSPSAGYDVSTGAMLDMFEAGIIDPLKVARSALENAASVAVTFLSLDAVIVDDEPDVSE
jgi:chaperonin GroEL